MKKIHCDLPDIIEQALQESLPQHEFVSKSEADYAISKNSLPPAPFKLGAVLDKINNDIDSKFTVNEIECDLKTRKAKLKNKTLELTEKECEMIRYFKEKSKPLNKEDILENVWGYSSDTSTRTVETHIHRLNQKMLDGFGKKIIISEKGKYSLA